MQIQVEIISISAPQTVPTKNGKSYQAIEVAYKKDGKIEGKKIMSFASPAVFKAVQNCVQGDFVTVTTEKNEAGYWQWESIDKSEGAIPPATQSAAAQGGGTSKSTGSNWETKEERAARQVMIVRQSSLSNAIATLTVAIKGAISSDQVIRLAKEYEAYVLDTEPKSATQEMMDME